MSECTLHIMYREGGSSTMERYIDEFLSVETAEQRIDDLYKKHSGYVYKANKVCRYIPQWQILSAWIDYHNN